MKNMFYSRNCIKITANFAFGDGAVMHSVFSYLENTEILFTQAKTNRELLVVKE